MRRISYSIILTILAISLFHAGCSPSLSVPGNNDGNTNVILIPESSLSKDCSPATTVSRGGVDGRLEVGDKAIEFTLKDIHGLEYGLSDLLATKPVLMIFGAFT